MPLMYLESMVDGAMKGIGEQKAAFRYSVWDAVLRIGGVAVLLPRYGMRGLSGGDLTFQLLHLRGQHRAAADFQRHRARFPPLAGCAAAGCCHRRCGRAGCAPGADGLSGTGAVGTAGSADSGRHGNGHRVFTGGAAAGALGGAAGGAAAGKDREKQGKVIRAANFLDTGGDCEYNTNV